MNVHVLQEGLAAQIDGLNLTEPMSGDHFAKLHRVWMSFPVLRFREQYISDAQLVAFSERFGPLDHAPVGKLQPGEDPATITRITVISNIVENGQAIGGLGAGEAQWHTDISYVAEPAKASALYALEVPASGGDTWFCNMYAAFDRLPVPLRESLAGQRIKHDAAHTSIGGLRRGHVETDDPREAPGALHPIIRRHPDSGRQALFVGRRLNAYFDGLSVEQSEAKLDEIWQHIAQPSDCWAQQWQQGDLVLWDNRAVMHRRAAFDPASRRLMHRTQVHGDLPLEG